LSDLRGEGIVRDPDRSSDKMEYDLCTLGCGVLLLSGRPEGTSNMQLSSNKDGFNGIWTFEFGEENLIGEIADHVAMSLEGVPRDQPRLSPAETLVSSRSDPCKRHLKISPI
jgi:hypothetical protein